MFLGKHIQANKFSTFDFIERCSRENGDDINEMKYQLVCSFSTGTRPSFLQFRG